MISLKKKVRPFDCFQIRFGLVQSIFSKDFKLQTLPTLTDIFSVFNSTFVTIFLIKNIASGSIDFPGKTLGYLFVFISNFDCLSNDFTVKS